MEHIPLRYIVRGIFWTIHAGSAIFIFAVYKYLPQYTGHAFVGAIALIAIFNNMKINTRRATLDVLFQLVSDRDLIKDQNLIRSHSFDTDRVAHIVTGRGSELKETATEQEVEAAQALMRTINYYEFIALGVKRRALDYRIIHELQHSNITRYWSKYNPIVSKIRDLAGSDRVFQEFECLSSEFDNHKLKKRRK